MAARVCHIFSLLCLFIMMTTCCATDTIYLDDECNRQYNVQGDVRVKLINGMRVKTPFTCTMTLKASTSGAVLKANFLSFTGFLVHSGRCTAEGVYLNNFFDNTNGYCNYNKPSDNNYNLGTSGIYSYFSNNYLTVIRAELLVTEVTYKNGSSCPDGMFDCKYHNECISDDLTCNGEDNCGNDRDEIEGCGLTKGMIVGIAFGVIAFIVIIVIVAILVRRCNR